MESLRKKSLILLLTIFTTFSNLGILSNFSVSAATLQLPANMVDVQIQLFQNGSPQNKFQGGILPNAQRPNATIKISPDYTLLKNALQNGDVYDDIEITLLFPAGTTIDATTIPPVQVANAAGVYSYLNTSVNYTSDEEHTIVIMTINDIQTWANIVSESTVIYEYNFTINNLFPNIETKENDQDFIYVKYNDVAKPSSTLELRGLRGAIRWTTGNMTHGRTPFLQSGVVAPIHVSVTGTNPVTVNSTAVHRLTLTPPNLYTGTTNIYGTQAVESAKIVQTMTLPTNMTVAQADISFSGPLGTPDSIVYVAPTAGNNGSYIFTWDDVEIPLADQKKNPQEVLTYVDVTIEKFTYDAVVAFGSAGIPSTASPDYNFYVNFTSQTTYTGIDPSESQPTYNPGSISSTGSSTGLRFRVNNPYWKEDVTESLKISQFIETGEIPPVQRWVLGGYNWGNLATWTYMDAIDESSPISYKSYGFKNTSGGLLENFQVKQTLGINVAPYIDPHANAYEKLYLDTVFVAPTTNASQAVTLFVELANDGTDNPIVVELGPYYPGTIGTPVDLKAAIEAEGYSILDDSDGKMRGNVVSVTFDYGKVDNGFSLLQDADENDIANEVSGKIIPHYMKDYTTGDEYVWSQLQSIWTSEDVDKDFLLFNNAIGDYVDGGFFFGATATVSFDPNYSNSARDGVKIVGGDDGIVYYNFIPSSNANKSAYNIDKNNAIFSSYENGDTLEFVIAIQNNDIRGRSLSGVRISDELFKTYIGDNFTLATWEIYTKEDADIDYSGNLYEALKSPKTPRSWGDLTGSHGDNNTSIFILYNDAITGTTTGDDDWWENSKSYEKGWQWTNYDDDYALQFGEVFVLRFQVDIKFDPTDPDEETKGFINNTFASEAAIFGTGGGSGDPWFPWVSGGVWQEISKAEYYIDVNIWHNTSGTLAKNKELIPGSDTNLFTIRAYASTDSKPTDPKNADMIIAAVMPYGWEYLGVEEAILKIDGSTYDITSRLKLSEDKFTADQPSFTTLKSTLVRWYVDGVNDEGLELFKDRSNPNDVITKDAEIIITFKAKTPDILVVRQFITGGYATETTPTMTNYHDRVYVSAALVENINRNPADITDHSHVTIDEYKHDGWDAAGTRKINNLTFYSADSYDPNQFYYEGTSANPGIPQATAYRTRNPEDMYYYNKGVGKQYSGSRLVVGSNLESATVWGHNYWLGLDNNPNDRLSTYADVTYRNIQVEPRISIETVPASLSLSLKNATNTYTYKITISNGTSTTTALRDLEVSQVLFRCPEFFNSPTTATVTGGTKSGSYDIDINSLTDVTGTLAGGQIVYLKFTNKDEISPLANIILEPKASLEITVTGTVVSSTFGPSGYGLDYSNSRLAALPAYASLVPTANHLDTTTTTNNNGTTDRLGYSANYAPATAAGSYGSAANFVYINGTTTGAYPHFRTDQNDKTRVNMGNTNYILTSRATVAMTRELIAPNVVIAAAIKLTDFEPITSSTLINGGSNIRWTITFRNYRMTTGVSEQKEMKDAVGYVIFPNGFELTPGSTVTWTKGDVNVIYSEPGMIVLENINLAVGESFNLVFETIVPAGLSGDSICTTYLIPVETDVFTYADVNTYGLGTYVYKTEVDGRYPNFRDLLADDLLYKDAVKRNFSLNTFGGSGLGAGKAGHVYDTVFGTPVKDIYTSTPTTVRLGDEVVYNLTVRNGSSANMSNIVIIDTLPRVDDKYFGSRKTEDRNSELPIFIYDETNNYDDVVVVRLEDINGSTPPVTLEPGINYTVKVSTSALVAETAFDYASGAAVANFSDMIGFVAADREDIKHIRIEYIGTLAPGYRLNVEIHTNVPTAEELFEVFDPLTFNPRVQLDGKKAVNNFGFAVTSNATRSLYNANDIILQASVTELVVGAFIDDNDDGYFDVATEELMHEFASGYVRVFAYKDGEPATEILVDTFIYDGETRSYFHLDPEWIYRFTFEEGFDATTNRYYWFRPFDLDDGAPVTGSFYSMIDSNGKYEFESIDILTPDEAVYVFGGFKETGPLVKGRVWNDVNKNGIMDASELGICDVMVTIYSIDSSTGLRNEINGIMSVFTDEDGYYVFDLPMNRPSPLIYGSFIEIDEIFEIQVKVPSGYKISPEFKAGPYTDGAPLFNPLIDELPAIVNVISLGGARARNMTDIVTYNGSVADISTGVVHYFLAPLDSVNIGLYNNRPNTGDVDTKPVWLAVTSLILAGGIMILVDKKRKSINASK